LRVAYSAHHTLEQLKMRMTQIKILLAAAGSFETVHSYKHGEIPCRRDYAILPQE